jgi:O-antigen ligase
MEEVTILPLIGFFVIFAWVIHSLTTTVTIRFSEIDIFLWLFIVAMCMAVVLNHGEKEDYIFWGISIELALFFTIITSTVKEKQQLIILSACFALSMSLVASLMILERMQIINLGFEASETQNILREGSTSGGINRTSFYLGIGTLLSVGLLDELKDPLYRLLIIFCIVLMSIANILTFSVSGMAALIIGFSIIFLRLKSLKQKIIHSIIIVLLAISLLYINERFLIKLTQVEEQEFIYWGSTRGATWISTIEVISKKPLFGVGPAQLPYEIVDYYNELSGLTHETKGAHNLFLSIAGESGLIGLFFFLFFLKSIVVSLWRYYKQSNYFTSYIIFSALAATLFFSMVFDAQRDKLFWLLFAMATAAMNVQSDLPSIQNSKHVNAA